MISPCRLRRGRQSRGAVLAAALCCLLVVMSLIGGMLQGALRARRQLHVERDVRQAELLLQAGVDRAKARIASDRRYDGESWNIPSEQILNRGVGRVLIEATGGDNGDAREVRVVAEYPAGGELSVRRSRTFFVQLNRTQDQEP